MDYSRRDAALLLPALMAASGTPPNNVLPSKVYQFDSLPVRTDSKTHNEFRQVFTGETHTGCPIDLHITTLQPGQMPHPSHQHVHEEMMLVKEGTLEVTISGKTISAGPGSVIYIASNDVHGLKNAGTVPAQYFVLAMSREV
jgi:quercetin dioxygenase-like cupin family protein